MRCEPEVIGEDRVCMEGGWQKGLSPTGQGTQHGAAMGHRAEPQHCYGAQS